MVNWHWACAQHGAAPAMVEHREFRVRQHWPAVHDEPEPHATQAAPRAPQNCAATGIAVVPRHTGGMFTLSQQPLQEFAVQRHRPPTSSSPVEHLHTPSSHRPPPHVEQAAPRVPQASEPPLSTQVPTSSQHPVGHVD